MPSRLLSYLKKNTFWFAIVLHILMLLSFSLAFVVSAPRPPIAEAVPAYAYDETKSIASQSYSPASRAKKVPTSKLGINKPATSGESAADDHQNQRHELNEMVSLTAKNNAEPVRLLGEKGVPKPLIVLIGKALTARLVYPKIAADLNVQGTAVIGFTIYPDGRVDHVQLVKSSHAEVLDQAALDAGKLISPVRGVAEYLSKEKFIVIGIMFR